MAYVVSLKQFDGPLDLLLTLISRAKLDIRDIFVSEITEQYLESISDLSQLDMEAASEFLTMAATLLEIKSRAMLPRPPAPEDEDDETPEQALIRRLTEYKAFKEATGDMQRLERAARLLFAKLPEEFPLPPPAFELRGLTLSGLAEAFAKLLARATDEEERRSSPPREIARDIYTVQECMFRIQSRLRAGPVSFETLFDGQPSRGEIVMVFVALLELIKLGRLSVTQRGPFEPITLMPIKRKPAKREDN